MRKLSAIHSNKSLLFMVATFATFAIPFLCSAQSETEKGLPFITNYAAKTFKALPQAWSVQEDDRGVMYFGIQNYLLEYNGVKWRKLSVGNSASSVVRSLTKDKNGVIYYGG